ncbi:beta propeller repeat protein [Roseimarinus sediminis]|uniref:hypothetical protein n=1 Tax=Roseimarinus sediminis TaxID=1610899 RepID=UPI003D25F43B
MKHFLLLLPFLFLILACDENRQRKHSENYSWKNVHIGGGGFVDGIVFHPREKGLVYARTDMGGAYRRDGASGHWIPLLDWVSYEDNNLMGVESMALDPNDPDRLYLACGTYTAPQVPDGEILVSHDRGESFTRVKVPFKMGGNENGRGNGERMMVDPVNGNIIYLGTRNRGLWRSNDAGMSWTRVEGFPDVNEVMPDTLSERAQRMWNYNLKGSGIVWVQYDEASANADACQHIYVGVSLMKRANLFRSTDGGSSWHEVPGHPQAYRPTQGVATSDGMLYITYGDTPGPSRMQNGAVWKYNMKSGDWLNITPDQPDPDGGKAFGYASVAVDAQNPQQLIVSSFYRPGKLGGEEIFRSLDGGASWTGVFANGTSFDYTDAPYVEHTPIHWMFDIEINPFNPDHALFTTGFGGFETYNLRAADRGDTTRWQVHARGIEETVPLELCSPPEGAHVISGIGDYAGFVHWNLDQNLPEAYFTNPYFGNCDGISCAWKKPEVLVRVGIASGHHPGSNIGYSTDYGKTWQATAMPARDSRHGHIAVAADGEAWIWTPQGQKPWLTTDQGKSWTELQHLKPNLRVVADKVNPMKFYAADLYEGLLFTSNDGGNSFSTSELQLEKGLVVARSFRGDRRGGQDRIYATPAYENDLWIAAYDGLYHSPKAGSPFQLQAGVDEIHGFGFGKAAPRSKYPALYLIGVVEGVRGIFRSDDQAGSWVRINDEEHQWGLLLHITGDPKKYGRVYVGTHGRGLLYGDRK